MLLEDPEVLSRPEIHWEAAHLLHPLRGGLGEHFPLPLHPLGMWGQLGPRETGAQCSCRSTSAQGFVTPSVSCQMVPKTQHFDPKHLDSGKQVRIHFHPHPSVYIPTSMSQLHVPKSSHDARIGWVLNVTHPGTRHAVWQLFLGKSTEVLCAAVTESLKQVGCIR